MSPRGLTRGGLRQLLLGLERVGTLLSQPVLITQKGHQLLGLLTHVHALVLAITVHVLEVLQRLNGVHVLLALLRHTLRARLDEILHQCHGLRGAGTRRSLTSPRQPMWPIQHSPGKEGSADPSTTQ